MNTDDPHLKCHLISQIILHILSPSSCRCVEPPLSSIVSQRKRKFAQLLYGVLSVLQSVPAASNSGILFFFLQDPCSTPPCWLRDFVQKPSVAFRTLHHLSYTLLVQFFHLSLLIFRFFIFPTKHAIVVEGAMLSRSLPPTTH